MDVEALAERVSYIEKEIDKLSEHLSKHEDRLRFLEQKIYAIEQLSKRNFRNSQMLWMKVASLSGIVSAVVTLMITLLTR